MNIITYKKLSSLEKVFLNHEPVATCGKINAIFKNETYSYQIALYTEHTDGNGINFPFVSVKAEGNFAGIVKIKEVGNVPSQLPVYAGSDTDYLSHSPGLFPDPLFDLVENKIKLVPRQWRSLWVELTPDKDAPAGMYTTVIRLLAEDGTELACVEESIEVLDAALPKQELIHTEWMHFDCIGSYYGVDMLSEEHWSLMERYIKTAAEHGVNMILTPLFTPPLDTKVGGERPTVQLVDVFMINGVYSFKFEKLKRFVEMCQKLGVEYFEMSHLFTQWGAFHAPKIIANVNGTEKKIFGWDTEAAGQEYGTFLDAFLPSLTKTLKELNISSKCWFHVSDEPSSAHLDSYKAAQQLVYKHLKNFKIIDALSDFEFYKKGLVKNPIPASDHIEPFLEAQVKDLWVYYCCCQYRHVSNRFMSMPSRRNRILSVQLFKYDITGFLHWGFNFWNSQYSIKAINPYAVTDAGSAYPSGDPFLVYPGDNGKPIESIRIKVLMEALYDLRAMKLLESLTSKEFVMNIIEGTLQTPITFSDYPRCDEYIVVTRNLINEEIKKRLIK